MTDSPTLHSAKPRLWLVRQVTSFDSLLKVLHHVLSQMLDQRSEHEIAKTTQFLIDVNATNGLIRFSWCGADSQMIGHREFTLELPRLHKLASKHESGAFFFDQRCRGSASLLAEESTDLPSGVTVMFRTELGLVEALP